MSLGRPVPIAHCTDRSAVWRASFVVFAVILALGASVRAQETPQGASAPTAAPANAVLPVQSGELARKGGLYDISPLRGLTVQDGGRRKPFDTLCREKVDLILGKSSYKGEDPVYTFLALWLEPDRFQHVKAVKIHNLKLADMFGKHKSPAYLSFEEVQSNATYQKAYADVRKNAGMVMGPNQKAILELTDRWWMAREVGSLIKVLPVPGKRVTDAWSSVEAPKGWSVQAAGALAGKIRALRSVWRAGDVAGTNKAIVAFADAVRAKQKVGALPKWKASVEVALNRVRPFRWAWVILMFAICFLGGAVLTKKRGFYVPGLLLLLGGLGFAIFGLTARTLIVARAPVSNLYEATVFATFACVFVGTIFELSYRKGYFGLAASVAGTLVFMLADLSPNMDRHINPLVPVLRSYWLNIHVTCMLLSYGTFAVALLLGVFYFARWFPAKGYPRFSIAAPIAICVGGAVPLFWVAGSGLRPELWYYVVAMLGAPVTATLASYAWVRATGGGSKVIEADRKVLKALEKYMYRVIQVGFLILTTGVLLGAVWANESWGRYWGWDPKETWAFITLLVYGVFIHGYMGGWFRGALAAIWSVIGFYSVLFTFYGVSYVLPGLHSYLSE